MLWQRNDVIGQMDTRLAGKNLGEWALGWLRKKEEGSQADFQRPWSRVSPFVPSMSSI